MGAAPGPQDTRCAPSTPRRAASRHRSRAGRGERAASSRSDGAVVWQLEAPHDVVISEAEDQSSGQQRNKGEERDEPAHGSLLWTSRAWPAGCARRFKATCGPDKCRQAAELGPGAKLGRANLSGASSRAARRDQPGPPATEPATGAPRLLRRRGGGGSTGSSTARRSSSPTATGMKWARQDSNLGPRDYESPALTAELRARQGVSVALDPGETRGAAVTGRGRPSGRAPGTARARAGCRRRRRSRSPRRG